MTYCCKDFEDAVYGWKFDCNSEAANRVNKQSYKPYGNDDRWYCTWVDGCENPDEFPINFCPFCGKELSKTVKDI